LLILAIDCALGPSQVALVKGEQVLARLTNADVNRAAEDLIPMVGQALTQAGLEPGDVERVAVSTGPGRFTSLRIAIAAARGLALAWQVPLVGFSTFEILAAAQSPDLAQPLGVVVPVGRGELALQVFNGGQPAGPSLFGNPEEILEQITADLIFAGPGASAFDPERLLDSAPPDIEILAQLAAWRFDIKMVVPIYARAPDADIPTQYNNRLSFIIDQFDAVSIAAAHTLHAQCFEQPWSAEALRALVADPTVVLILIGAKTAPVAMGIVRYVADESEILTLCVRPSERRQGHARQVMEYLTREAQRNGAAHLFLEVAEQNISANNLYKSLGFEMVGRRPNYYTNNTGIADAALILRRKIHEPF
jgi:tRNA threonylcarbamoyl adenosine modification protein YeaZ